MVIKGSVKGNQMRTNTISIFAWLFCLNCLWGQIPAKENDKLTIPREGHTPPEGYFIGLVTTTSFKFTSVYGKIEVPIYAVQKIERKDEKTEILFTWNNEKITGFIATEMFYFQFPSGQIVGIPSAYITKYEFTKRRDTPLNHKDYLAMKNGDEFHGQVVDTRFKFATSHSPMNISVSSIIRMEDADGQTKLDLSDGATVVGKIDANFVNVMSNYGFKLKVPLSNIKSIQIFR